MILIARFCLFFVMAQVTLTMPARDLSSYSDRARELTSKPCYYIMATSTLCLVVIVYFQSKTRVENELQAVVQAKSDNGTKQGVLTINLHNQGRGGNTRRTKTGLGWVGWCEG
jgi:hypothetical protein